MHVDGGPLLRVQLCREGLLLPLHIGVIHAHVDRGLLSALVVSPVRGLALWDARAAGGGGFAAVEVPGRSSGTEPGSDFGVVVG